MYSGGKRPAAMVTGASSGIGEVFARRLSARGFRLILVARREDRLRELAVQLGADSEVVVADLATEAGLALATGAIEAEPNLEVLVNNAGFGTRGRFWEAAREEQEEMQRLNVMAMARLTHCALRGMVARDRGVVINVASVAAFGAAEGSVGYCASKAWVVAFSEGLDMELRGSGSRAQVQALCPGFTYSEFHDRVKVNRGSIAKFLWLSAEEVVEDSLGALDDRRWLVIPNWKYRLAVFAMRHMPWALRCRMGRPGEKRT